MYLGDWGRGGGGIIKGSEGEEQNLKDNVGVDQIPVKVFKEGVVLRSEGFVGINLVVGHWDDSINLSCC